MAITAEGEFLPAAFTTGLTAPENTAMVKGETCVAIVSGLGVWAGGIQVRVTRTRGSLHRHVDTIRQSRTGRSWAQTIVGIPRDPTSGQQASSR